MRRHFYIYALLFVWFMASAAQVRAQQDLSKVQMKATRVGGNIYMLEGAGGNIGVSAGADGILIVDDQFAPLADKIRAALKELNPGQLRFVLNTHYHGDHTGANAAFGKEATIIAHDNVRARLAAAQTVLGNKVPASPKEALPVITYAESVSIHFNGEEIRLIHYPNGHTDGDS
ncbi:MAG: MBL fold metallo-hydrolase, partial [Acidobacteria bacterium]|nr:MBL fold metallo-hydrolase [Acidobacteriota bacterium]